MKDEEKFKDNMGNIIEIETRGERQHDKIYFKVKDVANGFDMENLQKTIITDNYENIIHYKYFNCEKVISNEKNQVKNLIQNQLLRKNCF